MSNLPKRLLYEASIIADIREEFNSNGGPKQLSDGWTRMENNMIEAAELLKKAEKELRRSEKHLDYLSANCYDRVPYVTLREVKKNRYQLKRIIKGIG